MEIEKNWRTATVKLDLICRETAHANRATQWPNKEIEVMSFSLIIHHSSKKCSSFCSRLLLIESWMDVMIHTISMITIRKFLKPSRGWLRAWRAMTRDLREVVANFQLKYFNIVFSLSRPLQWARRKAKLPFADGKFFLSNVHWKFALWWCKCFWIFYRTKNGRKWKYCTKFTAFRSSIGTMKYINHREILLRLRFSAHIFVPDRLRFHAEHITFSPVHITTRIRFFFPNIRIWYARRPCFPYTRRSLCAVRGPFEGCTIY